MLIRAQVGKLLQISTNFIEIPYPYQLAWQFTWPSPSMPGGAHDLGKTCEQFFIPSNWPKAGKTIFSAFGGLRLYIYIYEIRSRVYSYTSHEAKDMRQAAGRMKPTELILLSSFKCSYALSSQLLMYITLKIRDVPWCSASCIKSGLSAKRALLMHDCLGFLLWNQHLLWSGDSSGWPAQECYNFPLYAIQNKLPCWPHKVQLS